MNINYGSSVFVVPAVVNDYLDSATLEQLKVILYILQFPQKTIDFNVISASLQLTPEQVEKAVHFWESKQVLQTAEKVNTLPESDMPFAVNLPGKLPEKWKNPPIFGN